MPRQIFKNKVLCAAGPLPGQLTTENLKHWTRIRKGEFITDDDSSVILDERTTHLLCTREQFTKRVPKVKEALKRSKRLHIVHCDWFEFSTVNERRESEKEYSMREILAKKRAQERELARIEKGKRDGEKFVNTSMLLTLAYAAAGLTPTDLFHIYHDRDFFAYQVDISRDDEASGDLGQRYTLCLWESDAKPHLYWFTAKFLKRKGDGQPNYYRPSICSGKWRHEFELFMDFFAKKTGIEWQDRVHKQATMPGEFFQYTPPTGGKPVGRRLRFQLDYCLEINALTRGLPWPPTEPEPVQDGIHSDISISTQQESPPCDDGGCMELDSGNGDVAGKPHKHASGENNTMPSGSTQPLSSDNETMHIQRALASEVCFCELERHISVPPHLEHLEQAVNDVNTESSQECIPQSH